MLPLTPLGPFNAIYSFEKIPQSKTIKVFAICFFCSLFNACHSIQKNHYDLWVGNNYSVDSTHFHKLTDALNALAHQTDNQTNIKTNNETPIRIYLAPGNYYEKTTITRANISLTGAGKEKTHIYFDAYAGQISPTGNAWSTPGSATLTLKAKNISIQHLTLENSFDYVANELLDAQDPKKVANAQAVALFIDQGSDKIKITDVNLLGHQDTLFVNAGRSWFDRVTVAGHVDFIFGQGNAVFTRSEIKSLGRAKPSTPTGFVTAPSTNINQAFGLTFIDSRFTRDISVPDHSVPLGRPWHPTTQFSDGRYADPNAIGKSVFIHCWMDKHITTEGWYSMKGTAKDGTKIDFRPEDSRFYEFQNTGPGAEINSQRRQLSDQDAKNYSLKAILGDWNFDDWNFNN